MKIEFVYDVNNIFNKIINKNIDAKVFYETNTYIIIFDINPEDNTHLLFIPKLNIVNFNHLIRCEENIIIQFYNDLNCFLLKLYDCGIESYKLIINNGKDMGQCIFHIHVHILSCDFLNKSVLK